MGVWGHLITHAFCACYKIQCKHIKEPISGDTEALLNRINITKMPTIPEESKKSSTFENLTVGATWNILVWVGFGWFLKDAHGLELQRNIKEYLTQNLP